MLCNLYLELALNFRCEHSFSKQMARQLMNNSKQSVAIFILIWLLMLHQQNQMTVLAFQQKNAQAPNPFVIFHLYAAIDINTKISIIKS